MPLETLEYAHYLGMVFPEDGQFLWIAEEGVSSALPSNWTMHRDPEGLVYFYDLDTSVACRQHPADERIRNMYYALKYSDDSTSAEANAATGATEAGGGSLPAGYLSMLIGRVSSRHMADALKNLPRKELVAAAAVFSRFDPEGLGVITLGRFIEQWQKVGAKKGGREYTHSELKVMFEAADLTGTAEVTHAHEGGNAARAWTDRARSKHASSLLGASVLTPCCRRPRPFMRRLISTSSS